MTARKVSAAVRLYRLCPLTTAWAVGLALAAACSPYSQTTRVYNGRVVNERPITEEAYAAYLEGATLEAAGKPKSAAQSYDLAREFDPQSPEIQTALARAVCHYDPEEAESEFERGLEVKSDYAPLHYEWARCALRRKQPKTALSHAERALLWAPFDYRVTELLMDILLRLGRKQDAERMLIGFVAAQPAHQAARQRWQKFEQAGVSDAAVEKDQQALRRAIASALVDGDDQRAVSLALDARIGRVTLGRIALEVGRPDLALKQGQLVWFADPENSDARILALHAAAILLDTRAYRSGLKSYGDGPAWPSNEAANQLQQLLEVRAGAHAAQAFAEMYRAMSATRTPDDVFAPAPPHELYRADAAPAQPPSASDETQTDAKGLDPTNQETAEPDTVKPKP